MPSLSGLMGECKDDNQVTEAAGLPFEGYR
jgi:hypothetical protein